MDSVSGALVSEGGRGILLAVGPVIRGLGSGLIPVLAELSSVVTGNSRDAIPHRTVSLDPILTKRDVNQPGFKPDQT